jgi:hypothetical protein
MPRAKKSSVLDLDQDMSSNGKATHDDQADGAAATCSKLPLRTRIDPADIFCDWNTEGMTDEDDTGLDAKWGKPPKDNFVRAHPTWSCGAYLLDCSNSSGIGAEYVLSKEVAHKLADEDEPATAVKVFLLVNRDGGYVFWPVKLGDPTEQQKPSDYLKTALRAVEEARHKWVKIRWSSRKGFNGYRVRTGRVELPDPVWPDDIQALFLDVVSDRYINDPADKVVQRYLGEE